MKEHELDAASDREIEQAAEHFAEVVRQCDQRASFASASPEEIRKIRQHLPLSPEIVHWYRYLAPHTTITIPQLGNWLQVYSPGDLVAAQLGYRWYSIGEGTASKEIDDWPAAWLVIGDVGADPIIADTGNIGTPVSSCLHGMGVWAPNPLASSLAAYLEAQSRWVQVCLIDTGAVRISDWTQASKLIWNVDGTYLPEIEQSLRRTLHPLLPDEYIGAWLL